jgi:hypothetical protein
VRLDTCNDETLQAIKEAYVIHDEIKNGHRIPFASWQEAKKSLAE